jgi:6-pyruvoyltetrahydropterin/6-carboxytetrahydropterin synthase
MLYLTRRETFSAAHRLYQEELSESENQKLYGKCANFYGHGHNYEIQVTVKGQASAKDGMVINLVILKEIIHREIIKEIDHKHLNHDVLWLKNINPTTENLVVAFWERLKPHLNLSSVKLIETENNWAEYRGE